MSNLVIAGVVTLVVLLALPTIRDVADMLRSRL